MEKEKRNGAMKMKDTAIEKVAHVLDYDDYGYGQTYGMQMNPTNSGYGI